jgi:hypothetical protein
MLSSCQDDQRHSDEDQPGGRSHIALHCVNSLLPAVNDCGWMCWRAVFIHQELKTKMLVMNGDGFI